MIDLISLDFQDLLIFGTPLLAIIFTYLLLKRDKADELRIVKRWNILRCLHYSLLTAIAIVTMYSVCVGSRPLIYFLIVSSLFITSVLYGVNSSERDSQRVLFLTALILAVSIPITVIAGNNFYPMGFEREPILQTGSLEAYQLGAMEENLYYYIPIEPLLGVPVALITGQTIITPLIYRTSLLLGMALGLLSLSRRLSHNPVTGIIAVFFFISIPSLSFIGRMLSLPYAIFCILFTIHLYKSPRASVIGLWIVSLPMIFAHPSGFVAVITVLLSLALMGINNWPYKGRSSRRIRLTTVTIIVLASTYWTATYLISLFAEQGVKFYSTIYLYFSGVTKEVIAGQQSYIPRYQLLGYGIFAYAWSVPVALSAALLMSVIFQFIWEKKLDPSQSLTIISAFASASIIFLAYLSYGGESGQYLTSVGYFLSLLSSSVVATKILINRSKKHAIIAGALLASFILVGTYSPDWAPLEHPDFETAAKIHPYHVYIEAKTVKILIPTGATVYYDYDFPLGGGNYKMVREVILQFISGADPAQFARPPITVYGIKEERFSKDIAMEDGDTVYSSGYHRIIVIQIRK